jgi:hypothetical protein
MTAASSSPASRALNAAVAAVAGVGFLLSLGALFLFGWRAALWVLAGGAVATLNLWVFGHIGRALLSDGPRRRLWAVVGALKFLALLLGVYLLLRTRLDQVIAFAAGYAALPLGITLATLIRPSEEEDAAGAQAAGAPSKDLVTEGPPRGSPRR